MPVPVIRTAATAAGRRIRAASARARASNRGDFLGTARASGGAGCAEPAVLEVPPPAEQPPAVPEIEAPVETPAFSEIPAAVEIPVAAEPAPALEPVILKDPVPVTLRDPAPEFELELPVEEPPTAETRASVEPAEAEPIFNLDLLPPEEQELHRRAFRVAKVSMQDIKMLRPEDVRFGRREQGFVFQIA